MKGSSSIKDGKSLNVTYIKELSSVFITVTDSNASSINSDIQAYSEISGSYWQARAILLQDHLSFQKYALWSTTVHFFWFINHNSVVFEVVENDDLPNSKVFKSAFDDAFFEIAVKS